MQRILRATLIPVAIVVLALGQAFSKPVSQSSQAEQEIIRLSRQFADDSLLRTKGEMVLMRRDPADKSKLTATTYKSNFVEAVDLEAVLQEILLSYTHPAPLALRL